MSSLPPRLHAECMAMGEPTVVRGPCESTVVYSALRHAVASPPRERGPAGGECAHGFDTVSTRAVCFMASTLQRCSTPSTLQYTQLLYTQGVHP